MRASTFIYSKSGAKFHETPTFWGAVEILASMASIGCEVNLIRVNPNVYEK